MKEWFKARNIWGAAFLSLSDAEAGRLAKALWSYTMGIELPNLSGAEKAIFAMILMTLGQDKEVGAQSGENHWNWKGGITPKNQKERNSSKYSAWRKAVFERDDYTCQICGIRGSELNAHHIKRWSTNVNERYQLDNGITLCKKCHSFVHSKAVG